MTVLAFLLWRVTIQPPNEFGAKGRSAARSACADRMADSS